MKSNIKSYLKSIGMEKPLIERVDQVCELFTQLTDLEIEDVFISEYVLGDGTRAYEDVRIFAPGMIVEANLSQAHDKFFFNPIDRSQPVGWNISSKDYDFKSATAPSRLSARLQGGLYNVAFRASGENCDVLAAIIQQYLPDSRSKVNHTDS